MKTLIAIGFVFFALSRATGEIEPPFLGDARPARTISIGKEEFAVFQSGAKNIEIVLASQAAEVTKFAASELQDLLGKRLGTEIPVVEHPTDSKFSLMLGISDFSQQAGIDDSKLCRDAFIIKTSGKYVYILGRDDANIKPNVVLNKHIHDHLGHRQNWERGTLFGIYDFLERFGGLRFYFPAEEGTIIPDGEMRVPVTDIYDRPDFEARWYKPYSGYHQDDTLPAKWKAANVPSERNAIPTKFKMLNWYRTRMQTKHVPCNHGLHHLHIYDRYHKTHPEYSALTAYEGDDIDKTRHKTFLCYSHGLEEAVFQDAKAFLTGQSSKSRGLHHWSKTASGYHCFNLMPPDSEGSAAACKCLECRTYFDSPQGTSDLIWGFVTRIAQRLKDENIPGYVTNLAYATYITVPKVEFPDNLWVMCAIKGPWSVRDQAQFDKCEEILQEWTKKTGRKTWTWCYPLKYRGTVLPGIPDPSPRAYVKFYNRMKPYIFGSFNETNTDYWIFHYMSYYAYGKHSWDNSVKIDDLLNEHNRLMFGKGCEEMGRFFDRLEYNWVHRINNKLIQTADGPEPVAVSQTELFTEIYNDAELETLAAMINRAERNAADDAPALKRIRFMRKAFLDVIYKASAHFQKENDGIGNFKVHAVKAASGEAPQIDGDLTDPFWKKCNVQYLQTFKKITSFNAKNPDPDRTLVYVGYDDTTLYIAFDCKEKEMNKIIAAGQNADESHKIWLDNEVEIFLDPTCKGETYIQLFVNSNGLVAGHLCRNMNGRFHREADWDAQFRIKTQKLAASWTVEIAIPFAEFKDFDGKLMKANFTRQQLKGKQHVYTWSPFMQSSFHEYQHFGTIAFTPDSTVNIFTNGTFEKVTKKGSRTLKNCGWGITKIDSETGVIEVDTDNFVSGGASLKLGGIQNSKSRTGVVQSLPMVKANTKYRLSFYMKLDNVKPFEKGKISGAAANFFNKVGNYYPPALMQGTMPWAKYSYEFTTDPNTGKHSRPFMSLRLIGASGTVWFDNLILEEIE